jgi:hypothetical protein
MSSFSWRVCVVLAAEAWCSLALCGFAFVRSMIAYGEFWFRVALVCGAISALCGGVAMLRSRRGGQAPGLRIWLTLWLVFSLLALFAFLLAPGVWGLCNAAHRMERMTNLEQIGAAMHAYAEEHDGRFPPAARRDKDGKALLSWRVLILPYLGEKALYDEFRLDEPWDSPHNLPLLGRMPAVYGSTWASRLPPDHTSFQVFVGPGTPFEIAKGPRLKDDFPDGSHETILVIEAAQTVPWTKPADLDYDPHGPLPPLGPADEPRLPYWLDRGAYHFALADGSVQRGRKLWPSERRLRHLIVRNDGVGWGDNR